MSVQNIHRANEYLNEALEMLDAHLYRYNGDIKKAMSCLSNSEQDFVAEEMEHCILDARYYLENYHVIQTEDQGLRCLTPFWESQEIFYAEILTIQQEGRPVKILCLKARQQGLCLDPKTKVLTADLRWIPLDEIEPGQEIVATDEGQTVEQYRRCQADYQKKRKDQERKGIRAPIHREIVSRGSGRKMRTATVLGKREVFEPAIKITMSDGRVLIATAHHKFLGKIRSGASTIWRSVIETRVGDEIRFAVEPWEGQSFEDGWFGGLLDGEGTMHIGKLKGKIHGGVNVSFTQRFGAVYDRGREYLKSRGYSYREETDKRKASSSSKWGDQPIGRIVVSRMNELFRMIGQTRPSRFIGRRWWEGREMPGKATGYGWAKVVSMELLPAQRMIDLQTSTKTFLAEGFVSHNSELSAGLVFHKTIFTETCNALIVAQDPSQSDFIFSKSRTAYDYLPWWMKPEQRYDSKGRYMVFDKKDDTERQLFPGLRSQFIVEAANKMSSVARGKTIRASHMTELSSWGDGGILAKSIFPTMNAQDELAILESTALGRQGFFFRFWKEVEKGRHDDWIPCFIPVYRTLKKYSLPIKKNVDFVLTKEEQSVKAKIFKKDRVVLPDEHFNWKRAMIRKFIDLTGSEWDFYGEYPSNPDEAFQGTGISAFPRKLLHDILERDCADPKWIGEIVYNPQGQGSHQKYKLQVKEVGENEQIPEQEGPGTRLHIWEQPTPEDSYYVGCDVSEGDSGSGDFSSIQVIKIGIGQCPDEQVAEWHGYENPTPLGDICTALGYMYNTAQIAIECNGVGISTNNQLWRINEYDNVYQWKHIDRIKNFITNTVGWYTNQKTRDLIITKTREAIMEKTLVIRSARLIDQMLDFAKEEGSSRYEGQEAKDDRVFGIMICRYCAHESDYGKSAMSQPTRKHPNVDCWIIYDPHGRKMAETKDYDQAFGFIVTKAGYSMRPMIAKNKVTWIVSDADGKKIDEISDFDVAKRMCMENKYYMRQSVSHVDFQNTDYSLVHDKDGLHRKLYEQGVAPEEMRGEVLLHAQMAEGPPSDEEQGEQWKNW